MREHSAPYDATALVFCIQVSCFLYCLILLSFFYFISVSVQILKQYRPIPIWSKNGRYADIPITDMISKHH